MEQVTYVIYKRFEPTGPLSAFILLFLLPGIALFQVKAQYVTVLGAVATVYPLHWSLTLFYILAYRLSPFHPLAEFPGPLPCKLSKFWMAFVTYQGNAHRYVRKLHAIYGDVVRIGEMISFLFVILS